MHAYTTELDFARSVAVLGGNIAMGHYRRDPEIKTKADGTFATEGDWQTEAQIRLRIARTFPEHNILGEEEGLTASGGGRPIEGAPTWVVDPIDGTNNYIAGIPVWATQIGLMVDGEIVLGVVHAPALGETYEAARGSGARMNYESIHVADATLDEATVLGPGLEAFIEHGVEGVYLDLARRCKRSRGFGDFWGHMLVARGAAHVALDPVANLWDFAPMQPIVTEAGGRITQFDGTPCAHQASCLTTNGALHAEVVDIARPHLEGRQEALDDRR
jgi:histidinol-phosphatase